MIDYVNSREPGAHVTRQEELRLEMVDIFSWGSAAAYNIIVPRLDFKKRAQLAFIVQVRFAPTSDGYGLYQWCKAQADWSAGEQEFNNTHQAALKAALKAVLPACET